MGHLRKDGEGPPLPSIPRHTTTTRLLSAPVSPRHPSPAPDQGTAFPSFPPARCPWQSCSCCRSPGSSPCRAAPGRALILHLLPAPPRH